MHTKPSRANDIAKHVDIASQLFSEARHLFLHQVLAHSFNACI